MSFKYILSYKVIIILSIPVLAMSLILPNFCFAQTAETPKDFEEAKGFGMKIIKSLPDATRGAWGEAKGIWQRTWVKWWRNDIKPWFRAMWYKRAKPFTDRIINKVRTLLGQEIEKREPILKQEFEKEKQELKQELPGISKGLWERFKELLK